MERHNHQKTFSIRDFECKGQELIHIMLTLCEARTHNASNMSTATGDAMIEAALSVKAGIRTFISIERLPDK